jgi:hypothetical protein
MHTRPSLPFGRHGEDARPLYAIKKMKIRLPKILNEIKANKKLQSLFNEICFQLDNDIRYYCTPIDAISFGRTGSNGSHFCFLTDFGLNTNLEEAPIIFVNPSEFEYEEVKLIANNINEFFGLICYVKGTEFFVHDFRSKENLNTFILEQESFLKEDEIDITMMNILFEDFLDKYKVNLIKNPIKYLKEIKDDRNSKIQQKTDNGLGIINQDENQLLNLFDFNKNDLSDIEEYLNNSSKIEKFLFYREFMYKFNGNKNWDKNFSLEDYLYQQYWKKK